MSGELLPRRGLGVPKRGGQLRRRRRRRAIVKDDAHDAEHRAPIAGAERRDRVLLHIDERPVVAGDEFEIRAAARPVRAHGHRHPLRRGRFQFRMRLRVEQAIALEVLDHQPRARAAATASRAR